MISHGFVRQSKRARTINLCTGRFYLNNTVCVVPYVHTLTDLGNERMAKKILLLNSTKLEEDELTKGKRFNFDIVSAELDFNGIAQGSYIKNLIKHKILLH